MTNSLHITSFTVGRGSVEAHVRWMSERQLPALLARSGVSYACLYREVPHHATPHEAEAYRRAGIAGDHGAETPQPRHLVVLGAATPDVFLSADWSDADLANASDWSNQLALRDAVDETLLMDESIVNGRSLGNNVSGALPARVIQLGRFEARSVSDDFELARFYRQSRFPAVAMTPGCVRLRKMLCVAGQPKHGVFYEFESSEDRESHFQNLVDFGTGYGADVVPEHRKMRRYPSELFTFATGYPLVAERIWPRWTSLSANAQTSEH